MLLKQFVPHGADVVVVCLFIAEQPQNADINLILSKRKFKQGSEFCFVSRGKLNGTGALNP